MNLKFDSTKFFKNESGFGLTESIVSILLLSILVAFSTLFITRRLQTIYSSNLINAINDEIKRDIQKLKYELWKEHLQLSSNVQAQTSFYDVGSPSKSRFCKDILNTMVLLPSWNPTTWTPNSNSNSVSGQLKNKVFTGRPVTITREFISERPFNSGSINFIDKSLSKLVYKVTYGGTSKYWTSIDLTSEAHSWCSPS
jgi:competence protein ComGC